MRPLDPRLLRHAQSTRRFLATTVVIGVLTAAMVIIQAFVLARIIVAGFQQEASLASQRGPILVLAAVVVVRAVLAWITEGAANASSAKAKSELRSAVLEHAVRLGPVWLAGTRSGELTTLCTRGVDALDGYFARYLPQLVLACIVPIGVLIAIATQDLLSAVLVGVTLPLIPLFMALIGRFTRRQVDRQWRTLAVLSGHFLDVVAGLPTLKAFGRGKAQARSIADVGEEYRGTTMGVLRVSFLSSLVLELIATLSVAVVAVGIGLRLVNGSLGLTAGLTVLLLAPEAYLPIRLVGQYFHAAAEGVGAAERMLSVVDTPLPMTGQRLDIPDLRACDIEVVDVTVGYPDRPTSALRAQSLVIEQGRVTAIAGENGAGKSTVLALLMGFVAPSAGGVFLRHADGATVSLADLDPDAWRSQVAYLPQAPYLGSGTVADAVRLGAPTATDDDVRLALAAAGLDLAEADVRRTLPEGLDTLVGEGGVGLSAGQVRRVALARTLCRDAPLVLLDEPTSALDGTTERVVVEAVEALRRAGRTVVVVAHRPALLLIADVVILLEPTSPEEPVGDDPEAVALALAALAPTAPPWTERA